MPASASLRLERVTLSRSRAFREAFAIYEATIPRAEQKTRAQIVAGFKNPDVYVWALLRDEAVIGLSILYAAPGQNLLLLEYLAISPAAQGQGIGTHLFEQSFAASRLTPDAVLLIEVDSEMDKLDADEREVRIKRKAFYRRLGCLEVERFDYILPLDHHGPAPRMSLLVKGAAGRDIAAAQLKAAVEDIYANVYGCRRDDPRIAAMFAPHGASLALI